MLRAGGFKATIIGWDRGWNLPSREEREGYQIVRIRLPAPFGQGLRNALGVLRWQRALLAWLLEHRDRYAIIHACDLDTALPSLLVARLFQKPIVFDIFDSYADAYRVGSFRRPVRWLEGLVVSWSDAVIIADEVRLDQLGGARPRRLVVVYNSPPDVWSKWNAVRNETGKFRIAYVGLLDATRGLFPLLDVMAQRPEWELDLAGFGVDEGRIVEQARRLPNVRFHGRVHYNQSLRLMAEADVLVATYDPAVPNHRYASPNKLFEAMMLGKPIVVARGTHIDELVEKHGCGIVVPYADTCALDAALGRLASDPDLRQALGRAGRRAYEAYYHWDQMEARLVSLYRELLAQGSESGASVGADRK